MSTIEFKSNNEINKAILSTKEDFNKTLNEILKYWWLIHTVKQYIDLMTWNFDPSELLEIINKHRIVYKKEDSKKYMEPYLEDTEDENNNTKLTLSINSKKHSELNFKKAS